MADKVNLSNKVPSYSCRCGKNPKNPFLLELDTLKPDLKISNQIKPILTHLLPLAPRNPPTTHIDTHTHVDTHHLPQGHEARPGLSVAGETKKTITLTYAPASALCGVAKLFTANAIRWCVCLQNVRACPIVWGHLVHERASVFVQTVISFQISMKFIK